MGVSVSATNASPSTDTLTFALSGDVGATIAITRPNSVRHGSVMNSDRAISPFASAAHQLSRTQVRGSV